MFKIARIRLTFWYTLIISVIVIILSAVIYGNTVNAIHRNYIAIEERIGRMTQNTNAVSKRAILNQPELLSEQFEAVKQAILIRILIINGGIIFCVAILSYLIAGLTLRPIERSHARQKRFVSDASHELRTPLTSLILSIELALRDKSLSIQSAREILSSNLEDVQNLHTLVDQLLLLASSNGAVKKTFKKLFIKNPLQQAMKQIAPKLKEKHISVSTSFLDTQVTGNESMLNNVFRTVLENAVKFSPKKTEITIQMVKARKTIHIAIQDQGIGIAKKDIPFIFDRFYQVDNVRTTNEAKGFGIGLSLAKKLVLLHGGTIEVESKENNGTTITISLPSL